MNDMSGFTDSGDCQPEIPKAVYRVPVCILGGCVDPDHKGHRHECPLSATWYITGDFDVGTYLKLNAHVIGAQRALEGRGYDARRN